MCRMSDSSCSPCNLYFNCSCVTATNNWQSVLTKKAKHFERSQCRRRQTYFRDKRWKYPSIYPSIYPSEIFPSNICFWRRCHCQISWERKRMKRIKEDYPCHPLSVRPSNFLLMTFRKRLSEIFILLQQPLEIQYQEQHVSCFWPFWRFSRCNCHCRCWCCCSCHRLGHCCCCTCNCFFIAYLLFTFCQFCCCSNKLHRCCCGFDCGYVFLIN